MFIVKKKQEEGDQEKKLKCSSFLNLTSGSIDMFLQKGQKIKGEPHLSKLKEGQHLPFRPVFDYFKNENFIEEKARTTNRCREK